jgi:hypothetical protein
MRKTWIASIVAAISLTAGIAAAQSPPPPAQGGAYESLSPGNQKIANAIFDAQQPTRRPGSTKPLSLDEIAAMKQGRTIGDGKGWGGVWTDMRSQGLVQGNLGRAVSQANHANKSSSFAGTEITTASGRTMTVGGAVRSSPDGGTPARTSPAPRPRRRERLSTGATEPVAPTWRAVAGCTEEGASSSALRR